MRIDFVTTFGLVHGFPSFPEAVLARALIARGHTVRALTYYAKSSPMIDEHHTVVDGVQVHRVRRKGHIAPGTLRWIAQDPPDVAHIHHLSNRLSTLALPAYHTRRVPVLFSPYGILHDPELVADTDRPFDAPLSTERIQRSPIASLRALGLRHGAHVWAVHRALYAADAVHGMSKHECDVLIDVLGVQPERVHFIPLGIDTQLLIPDQPVTRSAEPTVLFLGQMKYRKGWDILVRAIPEIVHHVPDARFIFAGHTGRDRADFDALTKELSVTRWLDLRGRVDEAEKIALLRSAWALALPARYEGFGLPLVEAMMCGTPVVTANVPACSEIVHDAATGLVVPPDDPAALARAIVHLLRDHNLRERLGTSGKDAALARYSTPVIAAKFEALYLQLRERRG